MYWLLFPCSFSVSISQVSVRWKPIQTQSKGQTWPLHPIRFRLISLFFRVEGRDEERHWALCNPPPPSLLSSTLLPIHLLWLCLWLWKSFGFQQKANSDHTFHHDVHTHSSWHKGWKKKISCHRVLLLSGWKCHRNKVLTMREHLNTPLKIILVKFSKLWLQAGWGEFHCRFYGLQRRILPHHSGMMFLLWHLIQK